MDFPKRLKELRTAKKLSQEELGKILNYGRTAISGYELGRNEPSHDVLVKLSQFFDVSIDYLIGTTDIPNPEQKTVIIENKDLPPALLLAILTKKTTLTCIRAMKLTIVRPERKVMRKFRIRRRSKYVAKNT